MVRWPVFLTGSDKGRIMSWPSVKPGSSAKFSAMVLPVTVMQSPWIIPFSKRYLSTAGVPPTVCKSSMTYLPLETNVGNSNTETYHLYEIKWALPGSKVGKEGSLIGNDLEVVNGE